MQQFCFQVKSPWRRTHLPKLHWGASSSAATEGCTISSRKSTGQTLLWIRASMRFDLQASGFGVQVRRQSLCLGTMVTEIRQDPTPKCIFSHNLPASQKTFADSSCPLLPSSNVFIPQQKNSLLCPQKCHCALFWNAVGFVLCGRDFCLILIHFTLWEKILLLRRTSRLNSYEKENEEDLLGSKRGLSTDFFYCFTDHQCQIVKQGTCGSFSFSFLVML